MAAYIVACGAQPDLDHRQKVAGRLATYGEFRQLNNAMWLLEAEEEALDILPDLKACIGEEQPLFVARLQGDAAWEGYSASLGQWMSDVMLQAYDSEQSDVDTMAMALAVFAPPVHLNS